MANEFITRNGFISLDTSQITGSLLVNGSIGIGTTPSSYILETVNRGVASSNAYFGTGTVRIGGNADAGSNQVLSLAPGRFGMDNPGVANGRFIIEENGRVGIGTATPSYGLHIRNYSTTQTGCVYVNAQLNSSGKGLVIDSTTRTTDDNAVLALEIINRAGSNTLSATVAGDVGIGTAIPLRRLHVRGGAGTAQIQSTGVQSILYFGDANSSVIDNQGIGSVGNDLWFMVGATEKVRIDANGNVGIGTSNPASLLHVNGNTTIGYSSATAAPSNGLLVNGSVGIGTTAPSTKLDIIGPDGSVGTVRWQNPNRKAGFLYSDSVGVAIYDSVLSDAGIYLAGNVQIDFRLSGSIRMIISGSSGNVGIGSTVPGAKLDVSGQTRSNTYSVRNLSGGTVVGFLGSYSDWTGGSADNNMSIGTYQSAIAFFTNNDTTERMRITSVGSIGIGTSNPASLLHVNGNATIGYSSATAAPSNGLLVNGNVGIGNTAPQARLDLGSNYGANGEKLLVYNDDNTGALAGTKVGFYMDRFGLSNSVTFVFPTLPAAAGSYIIASKATNSTTLVSRMTVLGESGNVGIGTSNPASTLHVNGNTTIGYSSATAAPSNGLLVNGSVGVGTTNPSHALQVIGVVRADVFGLFRASSFRGGFYTYDGVLGSGTDYSPTIFSETGGSGTNGNIYFCPGGSSTRQMTILSGGSVGIGTTAPGQKLTVNGIIESLTDGLSEGGHLVLRAQSGGTKRWNIDNYSTSDTLRFFTEDDSTGASGDVKMVILSGGNVGIGSTVPGAKLDVVGLSGNVLIRAQGTVNSTNSQLFLRGGSPDWYFDFTRDYSTGTLYIQGNQTSYNNIALAPTSGNVGIGTTDPSYKLDVSGTARTTGNTILASGGNYVSIGSAPFYAGTNVTSLSIGGTFYPGIAFYTGSTAGSQVGQIFTYGGTGNMILAADPSSVCGSTTMQFEIDGSTKMLINANGNVGIGTTNPGANLVVFGSSTTALVGSITSRTLLYSTYNSQTNATIEVNNSTTNGTSWLVMSNSNNTSGNSLGAIAFTAAGTAAAEKRGALINSDLEASAASTVTARLSFWTNNAGTLSEKMRITSAGDVGIGTTSPDTYSYGGSRSFLTFLANGTNQEPFLQLIANGTGNSLLEFGNATIRRATIIGFDGSHLAFYTNGSNSGTTITERMRITSGGNVGIGTTTPNGKLQVKTGTNLNLITSTQLSSVSLEATNDAYSTNVPFIIYGNPTSFLGGSVGIGTTAPDAPLEIYSSNTFNTTTGANAHLIIDYNSSTAGGPAIRFTRVGVSDWSAIQADLSGGTRTLKFIQTNSGVASIQMAINANDGNVGIGTASPAARLQVSGSSNVLNVRGSGSVSIPSLFSVDGTSGRLFDVTDTLSGSLFSVNTAAGLPVIEAFSDNTVRLGTFSALTGATMNITGSNVGIGTISPSVRLHVVGGHSGFEYNVNSQNALHLKNTNASGYSVIRFMQSGIIGTDGGQAYIHFFNSSWGSNGYWDANSLASGTANGNINFYVGGANQFKVWINDSQRLTITSGGSVGIGTTNPIVKLHVRDVSGTTLVLDSRDTTTGAIDTGPLILFIGHDGVAGRDFGSISSLKENGTSGNYATYMAFSTRTNGSINAEKMRINSNGNVGIGNTAPQARLDLGSNYGANGEKFFIYNDNNTGALAGTKVGFYMDRFSLSNNSTFVFPTAASAPGSYIIASKDTSTTTLVSRVTVLGESGNVGIGTRTPAYLLDVSGTIRATGDVIAYSDARVKENVETITNALNKVTSLRGVTYTRKDSEDKSRKVGVIAQEVLDILPEVVQQDDSGNYSVAYGNIVGVLIEAIKELKAEINELKNNK